MYVYVNMQVCILLHISIIHVCYIKFSVYTCMCMVIEPLISDHRQKLERLKP